MYLKFIDSSIKFDWKYGGVNRFFYIALLVLALVSTAGAATVTVVSPTSLPGIIRDVGADTYTKDAADELADYLSRVSGRTISVVTNPDDLSGSGAVIHVGEDSFTDTYAPEIASLYADGFIMKYINFLGFQHHIILAGKMDRASQYAVEQFLKDYAGVRWLFPDPVYGEHVPSMPTVTIDDSLNETHEPDYTSRHNFGMYYLYPDKGYVRGRPVGSQHGNHALQFIFNNGSYSGEIFDLHPDWFPWFNGQRNWWEYGNGWQICFANPNTVDHAVQHCLDYFAANPGSDTVSVGQNDGSGFCTDSLCTDFMTANGFTQSELYWWWVNQVAAEVKLTYPNKWVESLAYSWSSSPPGFALESNVAITKTIVLDEISQAESWTGPPANCQSVNLYTYAYGRSFLGFRHYPTAMRDFLRWGRDTLGAVAHVTECGGDWSFDGPKYYYSQIFQWDADADPNAIMTEFCDASYGSGSVEMKNFWDRLEAVWESRGPVPYGSTNMRWLFYQWVGWASQCYIQPNDEFREYDSNDVTYLDISVANAVTMTAGDSNEVRYRVARMEEAWKYYRTYLFSKLNYLDILPGTAVTSEGTRQSVMDLAQEIADLRADRNYYMGAMMSYSTVNPRLTGDFRLGGFTAYTTFSNELGLIDEACTSISDYIESTSGTAAAIQYWEAIGIADSLYEYAQTQVYMLNTPVLTDLLVNGDFEAGSLASWDVLSGATVGITSSGSHEGTYNARLIAGQCYGGSTISQTVSVSPQERYRLSVWGKYTAAPDAGRPPIEAAIAGLGTSGESTRATFRSFDPNDGWTLLQSTVTVPPGADSATITVKSQQNIEVRIDDVKFERIKDAPPITHGALVDEFDTIYLDTSKWYPAIDSGGSVPPRIEDGWLIDDSVAMYGINSQAKFDELLDYTGTDRYRLRMRLLNVGAVFGIKSGTGRLRTGDSGFLFYHYFDFYDSGNAFFNFFSYQGNSQLVQTGGYLPITPPVTEVWYTLYFDPNNLTVYASDSGYAEEPADLVGTFAHGITDITANGSVYLKMSAGSYKIDEISLHRPPNVCGDIGTEYLDSDLDPNCYMNFDDVALFMSSWLDDGCSWPSWCGGADIDESNEVDFTDFARLLADWPKCTDPNNINCTP